MAEYIEGEATNADVSENTKIKTHFAYVIVERYHGKPYYNILYFDPTDKDYHIGFGSFYLEYVFKWLDEEFEIVESPAADVVEVKRGRWEHEGGDWSDIWMCTACGESWFFEYNPTAFCPNCGADMREVVAENATTTGGDVDG